MVGQLLPTLVFAVVVSGAAFHLNDPKTNDPPTVLPIFAGTWLLVVAIAVVVVIARVRLVVDDRSGQLTIVNRHGTGLANFVPGTDSTTCRASEIDRIVTSHPELVYRAVGVPYRSTPSKYKWAVIHLKQEVSRPPIAINASVSLGGPTKIATALERFCSVHAISCDLKELVDTGYEDDDMLLGPGARDGIGLGVVALGIGVMMLFFTLGIANLA